MMDGPVCAKPRADGVVSSLFLVPKGTDRTARGRALAAPLISDEPKAQRLVLRGIHPDLIELAPPPGKEAIGIDEVREVIRQGQFAPVQGKRKVCLIVHAEALTPQAANALLKVLEEPPRDLIFFLLAEHKSDILPTILSRSRVVRLTPLDPGDRLTRLTAAGYSEEEACFLLTVARREEELDRFLKTRKDLVTIRAQAEENLRGAATEALIASVVADDPILRHEGLLCLLDRLVGGDAELAVAAARRLSQGKREHVITLLEDLLCIAFALVRASLSVPLSYPHASLLALGKRVNPVRILKFCTSIERAQRAMAGYAPSEGVLFALFLCAGRLKDV